MTIESTYRLQLHAGFTFRDAAAIVPYLSKLGITHVYASPYLRAAPGSTHGYDVIDHNRLNPELGTEADFEAFLAALRDRGMGHILDIVPNHAGIDTNENAWWNDVLMHGPDSAYASHFDIAWDDSPRPELRGKVLLPVLGGPYGEVLERGELVAQEVAGCQLPVASDSAERRWAVRYYDRLFPIDPKTLEGDDLAHVNGTPGDAGSFDALHGLLERQHYRLAWWRTAADEINYRRFFDINGLAALAMERPDVFDAAHALVFRLVDEKKLDGLRIDHPDGLFDPKQYFQRLRQRTGSGFPIFAEKILAPGERLPADWPIDGTTGYEILNQINGLFVDPAGEEALSDLYREFTGLGVRFDELAYQKKLLILDRSLAGELTMLTHDLDRLAQRHRHWRDFTLSSLRAALRQVIACFPVYRSYIDGDGPGEADRRYAALAINEAARRDQQTDPAVYRFIFDALVQVYPPGAGDADRATQRRLAGKFQQLTAPTTAKGVEDTAFYCHHRLVSLNEVGGEPSHFGVPPQMLHALLAERRRDWARSMTTLSTHDTKRSEDVRARINVLSEIPDEWRRHVETWAALNESLRTGPAPASDEEYLLYQTLIGAWPLPPAEADDAFAQRIVQYMTKAMREAKLRTSWTSPDEAHERAVADFTRAVIASPAFRAAFEPLQKRIARWGTINSLAQTLLKIACPGVADTYQGTELWDLSLVDPDNRRPVDYGLRARLLESSDAASADGLMKHWPDGRVKLLVASRALRCRRETSPLFLEGDYVPLHAEGARAECVFAFARRHAGRCAIAIIPRLVTRLDDGWADTSIRLPEPLDARDIFTNRPFHGDRIMLAEALTPLPVALLLSA